MLCHQQIIQCLSIDNYDSGKSPTVRKLSVTYIILNLVSCGWIVLLMHIHTLTIDFMWIQVTIYRIDSSIKFISIITFLTKYDKMEIKRDWAKLSRTNPKSKTVSYIKDRSRYTCSSLILIVLTLLSGTEMYFS